jgi:GNAT superfamily N-acetyltransferase
VEIICRWLSELDAQTGEQVIALYNAVIRQESILGYPAPLEGLPALEVSRDLAAAVRAGRYDFLATLCGEELIGMALLEPNLLPNCRHLCTLSKGIIRPDKRARGTLKVGLLAIANRCRERRIERILLDVRENSRAHALWASCGFQPYGRLPDYARVDGKAFAGIYMQVSTQRLLQILQQGRREAALRDLQDQPTVDSTEQAIDHPKETVC